MYDVRVSMPSIHSDDCWVLTFSFTGYITNQLGKNHRGEDTKRGGGGILMSTYKASQQVSDTQTKNKILNLLQFPVCDINVLKIFKHLSYAFFPWVVDKHTGNKGREGGITYHKDPLSELNQGRCSYVANYSATRGLCFFGT